MGDFEMQRLDLQMSQNEKMNELKNKKLKELSQITLYYCLVITLKG